MDITLSVRETLEAKSREIRKGREVEADKLIALLDSLDLHVPADWKFNRIDANCRA